LPKGCKDLIDALRKCEYCEAPAVALHFMGMKYYRWCAECQKDLREFASKEDFKLMYKGNDEAARSAFRADYERRESEFMHAKVKARGQQ
jgi:hypothetical protein